MAAPWPGPQSKNEDDIIKLDNQVKIKLKKRAKTQIIPVTILKYSQL